MSDVKDLSLFIQRQLNLLCAGTKYTFTQAGVSMVDCNIHNDQKAFVVELSGSMGKRSVCPICFRTALGDIFRNAKEIQINVEQWYDCMEEECEEKTDYHGQCAFCRLYFCKKHLDENQCCAACLSRLEGVITNDESLRGS